MKIVISGPALALDADEQPITDVAQLQKLHGVEDTDTECAEHLDGELSDIGVEGGTLRLAFSPASEELRVIAEYRSPQKLTKTQLSSLLEYTMGQWSDGVGTDCFSAHSDATGIRIAVYPIPYDDDEVRVEQFDDGKKGSKVSPLFAVIRKGDLKKLAKLLDQGEDIEAAGKWGHTPLMFAVAEHRPDAVRLLIERGANVNHTTRDRCTCIQLATMQSDASLMNTLIEAGANVNERDERGATPLMWAANRGPLESAQLLVRRGADLNAQDSSGLTALMYAAPEQPSLIEFLLAQGADPNIRTKEGATALEEALQQCKLSASGPFTSPERVRSLEKKVQLLKDK